MPLLTKPASKTTRWFCVLTGMVIVFLIGLHIGSKPHEVTIIDDRFQVLGYRLSTGTNHIIYDGNQLLQGFSHWARRKTGLKVSKRGALAVSLPGNTSALLLRYRGQLDVDELDGLKAFLVSDHRSEEVRALGRYKGKDSFLKCYVLMSRPTNDGPFRLEFRLPSGVTSVATQAAVGELDRYAP